MNSYFSRNPAMEALARPFWEPIGQFVMAFGSLEKDIDSGIGILLHPTVWESNLIPPQIKNLSARIALLNQLVVLFSGKDEYRTRANAVTRDARRLNTFRNNIVHGSWGGHSKPEGNEAFWMKFRDDGNDFRTKLFEVRLSEIVSNTSACNETSDSLIALVCDVARLIGKQNGFVPWFDIPPEQLAQKGRIRDKSPQQDLHPSRPSQA